ncbi:DUF2538 family protein, partial [Staphylococcus warneri]|uniref:DUF2538 family protein n=1 Tax=Staphylococcus warneri TaxID=1292 RepID=UPI003F5CC60F
MSRKTYEKVANINGMFNMLEQQIVHSKDMALFRNEFFYVNHEHRENYEALLVYYKNSFDNPEFFYVNHEHRENYEALLVYYKNSFDNP